MLSLSRKQLLGLETVIDVALHARPNPAQARDIAKRQNVPQRYLEQLMQALVRGHILRGVRGPKGGYRLARERRRIMAGDIIRIIAQLEREQKIPHESNNLNKNGAGYADKLCTELKAEILARLDKTSIAELCENVHTAGKSASTQMSKEMDFTI